MHLRLVKDFVDFRIIYYWIDPYKNKQSPALDTLESAREWFIRHHYDRYGGKERRSSHIDRRGLEPSTNPNGIGQSNANRIGRRITDQPIHVAADLSQKKIQRLRRAYKTRNTETAEQKTA